MTSGSLGWHRRPGGEAGGQGGPRIATRGDAELLGDGEYRPVLVLWLGFAAAGAKRSEDAGFVGLPGLALFER